MEYVVPKNPTQYSANNNTTFSILVNDPVVMLNSAIYRLNGFTTTNVPNHWDNMNPTQFSNVTKSPTSWSSNVFNGTGVMANSTTVQANSTIVPATGYINGVPSYESNRNPTVWSPA